MAPRFRHHIIDVDLPPGAYAQTMLADLDGDGRLEFVTGQRDGLLFAYRYDGPDSWSRHTIGEDSPSDVGAVALDVDGDGLVDIVTGGAWYRNSGDLNTPFERIVFDADLGGVHDVLVTDIDGDGKMEVVTMSDQNSLRWYRIPDDARQPWIRTEIGPAVHAGAAAGDIDGDGSIDIVRTDVWFRNVAGNGTRWEEIAIGPSTPPPADFQQPFAFDATCAHVCDMNRDGRNDIVFTDAEIPGGHVWWMENVHGDGRTWRRHDIAGGEAPRRGPYHSLAIWTAMATWTSCPARWKPSLAARRLGGTSGRTSTALAENGASTSSWTPTWAAIRPSSVMSRGTACPTPSRSRGDHRLRTRWTGECSSCSSRI